MRIVLPVMNVDHWEVEPFMVFDTCIKCGAVKGKESLGVFSIGKRKTRCWTAECECYEYQSLESAIEEEGIIQMLSEYNIDHGQSV